MPTTMNTLRKTRAAAEQALREAKTDGAHLRLLDLLHALKAYEEAVGGDPAEIGPRLERLRTATARVVAGARGSGPVSVPVAATVRELDESLARALWASLGREPELLAG
ncbi:hypothetical protein FZ103_15590 [Streptomonospora sp. PA3]|uniref:hypothetical protein n=1 Tax=Streptomonospora sp. PA3 TaxID=2607326 RepID=UPI0012DFD1F4|nr:hypothetical protein [Streptomonospora sp. PA3]MUL42578.1 hypothetical protein [Streptomonospora sp. PA3]